MSQPSTVRRSSSLGLAVALAILGGCALGPNYQPPPLADGSQQIDAGLRDSIEFTRANLIEVNDMARYRGFDIIFCRNVLIYFDDRSRRIAAESLYDCLRPGGYICLGHSETMSRISPLFGVCRFPDAIVYQRPETDRD